jgi:uncharacterized phiE125 gp8 family phage protein
MEWRSLSRVSGPALEPVTPATVHAHLRLVEDGQEKDYATALIGAAREWAERRNGIATTEQVWELTLDGWWDYTLDLPVPPTQSITHVKYLDPDGVEQTLDPAAYALIAGFPIAQLAWRLDAVRPSHQDFPGAIRIRFVAGYADPNAVPKTVRQAILILVGTWFEHREAVGANTAFQKVPMTVEALLDQTKVRWW